MCDVKLYHRMWMGGWVRAMRRSSDCGVPQGELFQGRRQPPGVTVTLSILLGLLAKIKCSICSY